MASIFFGIQVVVKHFKNDPLRAKLHEIIASGSGDQTLFEKRSFWKRVCAVLNEAMPIFELGFWDLIRGDKAGDEFESWTSEIEGSIATEAEELGGAADEVNRLSSDAQYVLVSLLFLVEEGSNSDDTLGERCDIPENEYFTRQTLAKLIATVPLLNFANVEADAVYLMPGNADDGLSSDDIHGDGYEYLKPLA